MLIAEILNDHILIELYLFNGVVDRDSPGKATAIILLTFEIFLIFAEVIVTEKESASFTQRERIDDGWYQKKTITSHNTPLN
ncbi:hypothetical protein [Psychrobacillus glaciei]|uniref:hypothetical protein n=1 Tax=Psychrobacillus glaciei TaxID=2283160 RepID=UPI00124D41D8|nr:hypothetical protein [Psychrobacillus glaciei]